MVVPGGVAVKGIGSFFANSLIQSAKFAALHESFGSIALNEEISGERFATNTAFGVVFHSSLKGLGMGGKRILQSERTRELVLTLALKNPFPRFPINPSKAALELPLAFRPNANIGRAPIPIPMGERIPILPINPGMRPRPGYKFNYEGGITEMEGMVTIRSSNVHADITGLTKKKASELVRDTIHDIAEDAGLQRLQGPLYLRPPKRGTTVKQIRHEGSRWHETPIYGPRSEFDVQSLPFRQHGMKGVRMGRNHRRGPNRKYEGGTEQVLIRLMRQSGVWVRRR